MAGNKRGNKSRGQLRGGGKVNAVWLENNKRRQRKRNKVAKASKKRNR